MNNPLYKVFLKQLGIGAYAKYILLAVSVLGLFGVLVTSQSVVATGVSNALCTVFNTVRNVIFLLGITLMILGGAVYAGANLMPSQAKGGFQGYGFAMVIGGIVGVAIAVAAPFVLGLLVASGGAGQVLGSTGTQGLNALCGTTLA